MTLSSLMKKEAARRKREHRIYQAQREIQDLLSEIENSGQVSGITIAKLNYKFDTIFRNLVNAVSKTD